MAQTKMGMDMELMWQVISHCSLPCAQISEHDCFLGTVIGDNFGLARKATAIAVRVLNNGGSGSYAYAS